ncbi:MAG: AAA family ATPase [Thermodesulfobacteriota bacterium]
MYLTSLTINHESFPTRECYPFDISVFQKTRRVDFSAPVTFLCGANGSGKSALLDAIARKSGFLPWGGSKIHKAHGNPYETRLANCVTLDLNPRRPYGFHFRAESFFNFAASLDDILITDPGRDRYFGGCSLNTVSHGESFLTFFRSYGFQLDGLYLLDEPESALSPRNQVEFVRILLHGIQKGKKQYIVATHSPILLGCPGSQILSFDDSSIRTIDYRQTEPFRFYSEFLAAPEKFFES